MLDGVAVVVDFRGKVRQKVVVVLSGEGHEFSWRDATRAVEVPFWGVGELTSKPKHRGFRCQKPCQKKGKAKRLGRDILFFCFGKNQA